MKIILTLLIIVMILIGEGYTLITGVNLFLVPYGFPAIDLPTAIGVGLIVDIFRPVLIRPKHEFNEVATAKIITLIMINVMFWIVASFI